MDYPKSLYHHVIVSTPEDESAARAEGYRMLCEPENVPETDKAAITALLGSSTVITGVLLGAHFSDRAPEQVVRPLIAAVLAALVAACAVFATTSAANRPKKYVR